MKSLYEKLWDTHLVLKESTEHPAIIYIDTHFIHEVTSPQAFQMLSDSGKPLRRSHRTYASIDHLVPTSFNENQRSLENIPDSLRPSIDQLINNCKRYQIPCFGLDDRRNGIIHAIGPENGLSLPGSTIVCGDSHTSTHGAFAALAFGIGSSEIHHVFASQCLLQRQSKEMGIYLYGKRKKAVSAKDIILYIISKIGIAGANGHVIEFYGPALHDLTMEERMTICNMSIEAGARSSFFAVDEITLAYFDQHYHFKDDYDRQIKHHSWSQFVSDGHSHYHKRFEVNLANVPIMVSFGTNPEMSISIDDTVPKNADETALKFMQFTAETPIKNQKIDIAFIGSCTNGRIEDLRAAAAVLNNQKVANHVQLLIVPASMKCKEMAEAEGLDKIFSEAGAEWRSAGCSMCIAMNGDSAKSGQLVISSSNRNFEGRQGAGSRTVLASPATVAASAIRGYIESPDNFLKETK